MRRVTTRRLLPSIKGLPMKQYYCSEGTLDSYSIDTVFKLRCAVHEFPHSWGFYIMGPFSCVWTILPGSASFGRATMQFVCSDWACLSRNKGGQPSYCVLLCPICQKSAAQTMQQPPRAQQSLSAVESLSLSCCNHNSNYKSCFVSR